MTILSNIKIGCLKKGDNVLIGIDQFDTGIGHGDSPTLIREVIEVRVEHIRLVLNLG